MATNGKQTEASETKREHLSLKERLLKKAKQFDGKALAAKLAEGKDIMSDPKAVKYFAEIIQGADRLGLEKLSFDRPPEKAEEEWFGLSLTGIKDRLQDWAIDGNTDSNELLTSLRDFEENNFVSDPLWRVIVDIERPCRLLANEGELHKFLQTMLNEEFIQIMTNPVNVPENSVVIRRGITVFAFTPKKRHGQEIPKITAGWQFIKNAKTRLSAEGDKRQSELDVLKKMTTLTPTEALSNNAYGTVFAPLGTTRGILFEIEGEGNAREARIIKTVGVSVGQLPGRWFDWPNCNWSHPDVIQAIAALKKLAKESQQV